MEKVRILAIIPAYNEANSIVDVAKSVSGCRLQTAKGVLGIDVVVIDDGSADNTSELCKKNGIRVVTLPNNLGIGGAVQCGYRYAFNNGYDIAFQFDGDGQHDAGSLDALLAPILSGEADFVIGSRFLGMAGYQSTKLRRIGIKWLSLMIRLLTGKRITDPTSGFRAGNAGVIKRFSSRYPRDYPEPESAKWLLKEKFRIAEVPATMFARAHGRSSISLLNGVYYMIKVSFALLITR